jgi:hypothetical protein
MDRRVFQILIVSIFCNAILFVSADGGDEYVTDGFCKTTFKTLGNFNLTEVLAKYFFISFLA